MLSIETLEHVQVMLSPILLKCWGHLDMCFNSQVRRYIMHGGL